MVDSEVPEYQLSIPETWKTCVMNDIVPTFLTVSDMTGLPITPTIES